MINLIRPTCFVLTLLLLCTGCRSMQRLGTLCDQLPQYQRIGADRQPRTRSSEKPLDDLAVQQASHPLAPQGRAEIFPEQATMYPYNATSPAGSELVPLSEIPPIEPGHAGVPNIGGLQLSKAQMTATEHALKYKEEYEALKATHESILADNQRLRNQLKSTEELLNRVKVAMIAAKGELENAAATNRQLKQRIVDMESEHKRSQFDMQRILDSIRSELDDVLMREMALKGS